MSSTGLGEITERDFVPVSSFQLHPCACYSLISVLKPLGITSGLEMGLIPTVNSWFITRETDEGWKKPDTDFVLLVATWRSKDYQVVRSLLAVP